MTRTVSAHLTTFYASKEQTPARCLWIARRDGTVIGITDHDEDLIVDMPDISDQPVTFKANAGILPSDIRTVIGFNADNFEVEGPLGDLISRNAVLGRRFSRARVRLFEIDWSQDWPDQCPLMQGYITNPRVRGDRFVFEVRSDFERYNATIGRVIAPYCDADFGDARCGAAVPQAECEIVEVIDDFRFRVDLGGLYADDHFVYGKSEFIDGDLRDCDPVEIFSYVGATGYVTCLVPFPEEPEVGDRLVLRRGCSKLKVADDPTIPTCASYNNVLNFRGMDQVPGSAQYLKIAVPGDAGA